MDNFSTLVSIIIQAELHGETHELKRVLDVGPTPQILIKNGGFEDLDMVVKASTVCKICFDHGISTPIIQRLPIILDKPKALYESATHADSAVVMTYEQQNASPIVVAVQRGQLIGRNHKCNVVASMYGKQGHDPEVRWKRQGLLLWEA